MNHIKELRLAKGLTLKQVAEQSGIYIRQIQKYESGEYDTNKMTLKNAMKLLKKSLILQLAIKR